MRWVSMHSSYQATALWWKLNVLPENEAQDRKKSLNACAWSWYAAKSLYTSFSTEGGAAKVNNLIGKERCRDKLVILRYSTISRCDRSKKLSHLVILQKDIMLEEVQTYKTPTVIAKLIVVANSCPPRRSTDVIVVARFRTPIFKCALTQTI